MADKLSWTELRRALAARAGVSEKKAGAFLSAVQAQLVEALKNDKQLKINGLGTFKLQAVAPRKSVNVTTGEEILIEGYNKLAFTPEAGVKELIEKGDRTPVAEEKEAVDPLRKLGAQAEEIVDLLGDLGQSPSEEKKAPKAKAPKAPKKKEKAIVEPEPVKEPEPIVSEPVKEPEPIKEPEPVKEPEVIVQKPKKEKKNHFVRDVLICVVILLLLLFIGYFFLRQQLSGIIDSLIQPTPTELVEQTPAEPSAEPAAAETNISQEQITAEFLEASGETDENRYPDLITIEPMHEASRLAWMSKRFYGSKIYWPYLYDANRDILVNPSKITVGTPIRVPKLSKIQLDTTNAQTAARLEQLRIEAEEACRK